MSFSIPTNESSETVFLASYKAEAQRRGYYMDRNDSHLLFLRTVAPSTHPQFSYWLSLASNPDKAW